jgi:hypothetical protein
VIAVVVLVVAFLAFTAWREREHREERRELEQRIQAPERAIAAQSRREDPAPRPRVRPVSLDDDAAMTRAMNGGDDDGGS